MDQHPTVTHRLPGPYITHPDGTQWPALGLGTWRYGEQASRRPDELRALRTALEEGYRLIDTAEMYGDGGAETLVGEALVGALKERSLHRSDLTIVSKAYPHHASRQGLRRACEASLRRLRVEHLDLYLLHWRGDIPLAETIDAFGHLVAIGLIRRWGVSNFDVEDLTQLHSMPGGRGCAANQVYLSLSERGPETHLLPWQQAHSIPLMAYSPLDQGGLPTHGTLRNIAQRHAATTAQVALAALLAKPGVMVIPKSSDPARIQENWRAQRLSLTPKDLADLDAAFPVPRSKRPLAIR